MHNYECHMTLCLILLQIFILLGILELCSFIIFFFLKSFGLKARPFGKGGMISLREMEHY